METSSMIISHNFGIYFPGVVHVKEDRTKVWPVVWMRERVTDTKTFKASSWRRFGDA
jgi:hypothetical protein